MKSEKYGPHIMHESKTLFIENSERMEILDRLQERNIRFYHENLKHSRFTRTIQTVQKFMIWSKVQVSIVKYVNQCSV
jgi:hypothetical protein